MPAGPGETVALECEEPYVKSGDFLCVDGTFTMPVCRLLEKASGDFVLPDQCLSGK